MKNKPRFVRVDCVLEYKDGVSDRYEFTEWFCLNETWTHPYNDRDAEFERWCEDGIATGKWDVCPEITIDGAVLNAGWGYDMVNRLCSLADADDGTSSAEFACRIDMALTGEPQEFSVFGPRAMMAVKLTPFTSVIPDAESVAAFGPKADTVRRQFDSFESES